VVTIPHPYFESLEGAVLRLMEMNHQGHHLTRTQVAGTQSLALAGLDQARVIGRGKGLPKIIDMAEQFQ
jgi:hypothetical protein